jgi:putative Mn2+ efflux pump MntP
MTGGLLIGAVAAVGILHTLVPDHWAPIVLIARQRNWSLAQTARAAATAGLGHLGSTLMLGVIFWIAGTVAAAHYGRIVNAVSAAALIAFGLWTCYGWFKERGKPEQAAPASTIPAQTALLLVIGSSPMIEGIPLFLAAFRYGAAVLGIMAAVFAAATIATYVGTCVAGVASFRRGAFVGKLEPYGELISGILVALVGVYVLLTG